MDIIKKWHKVYKQLKNIIDNIQDVEKQKEIKKLLPTGERSKIILEEIQEKLDNDPSNLILKSEYSIAIENLLRCILEGEIFFNKLKSLKYPIEQSETKVKPFTYELIDFKEFVESDGIDIFWINRTEEKFTDKPETKAQGSFIAYFAAKVGRGRVFREVKSGTGRIDAIVIYEDKRYAIELKMLGGKIYGVDYPRSGVEQLFDYMHKKDIGLGYLLIFDGRPPSKKTSLFRNEDYKKGILKGERIIFPITIDINPVSPSKLGKIKNKD